MRSLVLALMIVVTAPMPLWAQEIRLGVLGHDVGVFGNRFERGADVDGEVLFKSPRFLEILWAPRPHLGVSINTRGLTSQAYAGLTWTWDATERLFVDVSLGGAIHNGELESLDGRRTSLGSRALFRESLSIGWRLTDNHSLSVMLAHISNARLAKHNEGMDQLGLRWGYRF